MTREVEANGAMSKMHVWPSSPLTGSSRLTASTHSFNYVIRSERVTCYNINDAELERARIAAKAIERAMIAQDPTIDLGQTFAEADKFAQNPLSRLRRYPDDFKATCRSAPNQLLAASPVSPYQTQRP